MATPDSSLPIRIIVAYDEARVIGHQGRIPWDLPQDRRHFVEKTRDGTIIMGRKTYGSLLLGDRPPLEGRYGRRVITVANPGFWPSPGQATFRLDWASDLDMAMRLARKDAKDIWIIGGEQVYRTALDANIVTEIVASEVEGVHAGDRHFPELGPEWRSVSRETRTGFAVVRYVREVVGA